MMFGLCKNSEEQTEQLITMIQDKDNNILQVSDENDNNKPEGTMPAAAVMRKCFQQLVLGLDETAFEKMNMPNVLKTELQGLIKGAVDLAVVY